MMRALANRLTRMEQVHGNSGEPLWVARQLIQRGDSIRDEDGNEIDSALRRRIETGALREDEHFVILVFVSPSFKSPNRSRPAAGANTHRPRWERPSGGQLAS
jgi:hypothetical protein